MSQSHAMSQSRASAGLTSTGAGLTYGMVSPFSTESAVEDRHLVCAFGFRFRVSDFGFGFRISVSGFGLGISVLYFGLQFRILGLGIAVSDFSFGFRISVWGFGFRIRISVSGFDSGCLFEDCGFGFRFRVCGWGFGVSDQFWIAAGDIFSRISRSRAWSAIASGASAKREGRLEHKLPGHNLPLRMRGRECKATAIPKRSTLLLLFCSEA